MSTTTPDAGLEPSDALRSELDGEKLLSSSESSILLLPDVLSRLSDEVGDLIWSICVLSISCSREDTSGWWLPPPSASWARFHSRRRASSASFSASWRCCTEMSWMVSASTTYLDRLPSMMAWSAEETVEADWAAPLGGTSTRSWSIMLLMRSRRCFSLAPWLTLVGCSSSLCSTRLDPMTGPKHASESRIISGSIPRPFAIPFRPEGMTGLNPFTVGTPGRPPPFI
mmetsp:Transcript_11539/g.24150  ORF Transcript_11539/g.24150 Transcript_11539/m.24150 type:complete len:227 (-) Transcript_11539:695-1375(-)